MNGLALDMFTSVVGNLIHFAWMYVLAVERRYGRAATVAVCLLSFVVFQGASLYLFLEVEPAEGSLVLMRHQLGIVGSTLVFALIASGNPLRNAVIYAGYIDYWLFVYLVALLVSREPTLYGQASALSVCLRTVLHLVGMACFVRVVSPAVVSRRQWPTELLEAVLGCFALVFLQLESLLIGNQRSGEILPDTLLGTLLSLAVTVLVGWLVVRLSLLQESMAQLEKVELQNRYLAAAVERDAAAYEAKMRARHALREHLRVLRGLATRGETERVLTYIDEMQSQEAAVDELRYSANSIVDLVVRVYAERAAVAGVRFSCADSGACELGFNDSDTVVLLSNLLEVALEGCTEAKDPFIELRVGGLGAKTLVECSYRCAAGTALVDGWPAGLGLCGSAMRQVVERCTGDVRFSLADTICTCTILLNDDKLA